MYFVDKASDLKNVCNYKPKFIILTFSRIVSVFLCVLAVFFAAQTALAQTVIYQDDFEGAVSGWSDNSTDNAPLLTNFLGRFSGGNEEVTRTFTVPAGATSLEIEFDLLRIDSWDFFNDPNANDGFGVEIDGAQLFSSSNGAGIFPVLNFPVGQGPRSGSTGNVDWSHVRVNPTDAQVNAGNAQQELGFTTGPFWFDQVHRFTLTINNPGATVDLTLRIDVNQGLNDESGGFDNFLVTAILPTTQINAVNDNFTATPILAGGNTPNILSNDLLNGIAPSISDVDVNIINDGGVTGIGFNSDGTVTLPAGTPAGLYTFSYEICDTADPTNCDIATVDIEVEPDFSQTGTVALGSCPVGFVPTSSAFNSEGLPFNTQVQNSAPLTFFGGELQTDFTLNGSTFWNTGAQVQNDPSIGDFLFLQPRNSPNTLSSGNNAVASFDFPNGIQNGTFIVAGLNARDAVTVRPSFQGVPIPITAGNFSNLDPGIILDDADGDGQADTAIGTLNSGGVSVTSNRVTLSIPGSIDQIDIIWGKDSNATSTTTIGVHTFGFCEIETTPELELVKATPVNADEDGSGTVSVGDTLTYTITATNTGNVDQNNVVVEDALIVPNTLTCPTLAVGADCVLTGDYVVTTADAGGDIINTAEVESDEIITPVDATVTTPVEPLPQADLVTVKTLAASASVTPLVGDTVTFDITVTNNGPDTAANVALSDTLPAGLTATGNNGNVTAGIFTAGNWTIPSLANGDTATLTLEGTVDMGEEGNTITNTLTGPATSDTNDPSSIGDDLTESVTVEAPQPSLSMTKIASSQGPFTVGDIVTYTYTVTNNGDTIIRDIAITDTHNGSDPAPIPGNETLLVDNETAGDSTDAATDGSWDTLAPGDVLTFTGTYTITQTDADNL